MAMCMQCSMGRDPSCAWHGDRAVGEWTVPRPNPAILYEPTLQPGYDPEKDTMFSRPKAPPEMPPVLDKPRGLRNTYVFTSGERLHLFDVTENNLSGAWHRVSTADGKMHIIDPAKVLYIITEHVK